MALPPFCVLTCEHVVSTSKESHILLEISVEHGLGKDGEEEDEEQQLQEDPDSLKIKLVKTHIKLFSFLLKM